LIPTYVRFVNERSGMNLERFKVGESVQVRRNRRSPYSGCSGCVVDFNPDDRFGAYLIRFDDSLEFRYSRDELELIERPTFILISPRRKRSTASPTVSTPGF
jgi:hypothetical protein